VPSRAVIGAFAGQAQEALPPVRRRGALVDQSLLGEVAENAAEIAGVERQVAADLARGGGLALRELVEHARFGEREGAAQQAFLQNADLLGVEAIEAAHRGDAPVVLAGGGGRTRHDRHRQAYT
jgi:hypothetical protein